MEKAWRGGKSIAHYKSLDFTFLPFTFLPFGDGEEDGPGRGKLTLRLLGEEILHIANPLTLPFYLLPFYLLREDGAVSRTDTEKPPRLYGSGGSMVSRMGRERYRSLSSRSMSLPKMS